MFSIPVVSGSLQLDKSNLQHIVGVSGWKTFRTWSVIKQSRLHSVQKFFLDCCIERNRVFAGTFGSQKFKRRAWNTSQYMRGRWRYLVLQVTWEKLQSPRFKNLFNLIQNCRKHFRTESLFFPPRYAKLSKFWLKSLSPSEASKIWSRCGYGISFGIILNSRKLNILAVDFFQLYKIHFCSNEIKNVFAENLWRCSTSQKQLFQRISGDQKLVPGVNLKWPSKKRAIWVLPESYLIVFCITWSRDFDSTFGDMTGWREKFCR